MGKKHEPSPYTALHWEQVRLAYWQRQGKRRAYAGDGRTGESGEGCAGR